jgi:hypothetical protein
VRAGPRRGALFGAPADAPQRRLLQQPAVGAQVAAHERAHRRFAAR